MLIVKHVVVSQMIQTSINYVSWSKDFRYDLRIDFLSALLSVILSIISVILVLLLSLYFHSCFLSSHCELSPLLSFCISFHDLFLYLSVISVFTFTRDCRCFLCCDSVSCPCCCHTLSGLLLANGFMLSHSCILFTLIILDVSVYIILTITNNTNGC